ncbi:MAG: polysaccharide deacetylase family protein [Propionicimonas sp.]|nr:polysaccharide deacetylase family protein [Propionicimonas sp.]
MINLCFHGIGTCQREREPGEARYWVTADSFRRILDVVTGRPQVRLSFDDGNASDLEIGLPELRERGLTATFFALAGRLDDPASLTPAGLRELRAAGMGIGSHGWDHIPWRDLGGAELRRELADARSVLSEVVGAPIDEAALPLGRYGRRLLGELKRYDYRTVYTSDRFPAREGSWLQARFSVTAGDTAETVRALVSDRPVASDLRNRLASAVKRLR